jgi:hypothetical protein
MEMLGTHQHEQPQIGSRVTEMMLLSRFPSPPRIWTVNLMRARQIMMSLMKTDNSQSSNNESCEDDLQENLLDHGYASESGSNVSGDDTTGKILRMGQSRKMWTMICMLMSLALSGMQCNSLIIKYSMIFLSLLSNACTGVDGNMWVILLQMNPRCKRLIFYFIQ